jgi:hypothetical protein
MAANNQVDGAIPPRSTAQAVVAVGKLLYGERWQKPMSLAIGVEPYKLWRIDEIAVLGREHPDAIFHEHRARDILNRLYLIINRCNQIATKAGANPPPPPRTRTR